MYPLGGRGSVLVCRNQHPKKENFKMGRGGKEFSINVTRVVTAEAKRSKSTAPVELLLLSAWQANYSQRIPFLFSHPIKWANLWGHLQIKCPVFTTYLGHQDIYLARKSNATQLAGILMKFKASYVKLLISPGSDSHSNSFDHHPQTNLSDPQIQHFTTNNQLFRGKRHLISFLL